MAAAALAAAAAAHSPFGMDAVHAHGPALHAPAASAPAAAKPSHPWGADYFPNVELTTQDGRTVRFYDDLLKGRTVAINVMYTDCEEVCALETASMVKLRRVLGERVGRDIVIYSISIDPKRDTPEVLKAYAERFGADWTFLTGRLEDIRLVTEKLGLVRGGDIRAGSHHAAQLMVGNEPTGQWTRTSAVDSPPFLAARIGSLLGWRDTQPVKSYAEARPLTVANGERLFASKCSACHGIGQGDGLGPDLAAVVTRRERAWLVRYIEAPDEVLAAQDPVAMDLLRRYKDLRMPNLRLAPSDVADLVSYLEAPKAARKPEAPAKRD